MTDSFEWRVKLSDVVFDDAEERAIVEVLRSGWLSTGPVTAEFEREFAEYVGAPHAVAVANGTAALHLALEGVGVGPGDEVVVPSLTFVATANAVRYCGATPVFADVVGEGDLGIDPRDVEAKLTDRTRAVLPVHYGGYPCDMSALVALARERDLALVEDGAHAPGARCSEGAVGAIGDATCFSFFSNKNMATGEGGMVTVSDAEVAARIRRARSHGMTAVSLDKHKGHAFVYDVVGLGFNYRLTEIESALGRVQLRKLARFNRRRRELVARYRRSLTNVDGLTVPYSSERDEGSACHLMEVVLPPGADRRAVQEGMKADRIQTSVHYPPIHRFEAFRGRFDASVPKLDAIADRLLTLPLHPAMADDDVDLVIESLARHAAAAAGRGAQAR